MIASNCTIRGGRFGMLAIDLPSLAQLGTFLGGAGTLIASLLVALRGRQVVRWFVDRSTLIAQRDSAVRALMDAKSREGAMREALSSVQAASEAWQSSLQSVRSELDDMRHKQTVFFGYLHQVVVRFNEREVYAREHGLDLSSLPLPDVPEELQGVIP